MEKEEHSHSAAWYRARVSAEGRASEAAARGRVGVGEIVGRFDVRRRLFLPLGPVEFQNRVGRDFEDAPLDVNFRLLPYSLFVFPRAKLPTT